MDLGLGPSLEPWPAVGPVESGRETTGSAGSDQARVRIPSSFRAGSQKHLPRKLEELQKLQALEKTPLRKEPLQVPGMFLFLRARLLQEPPLQEPLLQKVPLQEPPLQKVPLQAALLQELLRLPAEGLPHLFAARSEWGQHREQPPAAEGLLQGDRRTPEALKGTTAGGNTLAEARKEAPLHHTLALQAPSWVLQLLLQALPLFLFSLFSCRES